MPLRPSTSLARLVGYTTAILAFLGLIAVGVFLVSEYRMAAPRVQVRFPVISTLREGDPVVENGVAVGRVERITLDGVTLRLFHDVPLPEDTRFYNLSHSLMGARKVWLVRGVADAETRPLDRARVQDGVFVPGLPETLHKVDALRAVIARLRATADSLLSAEGDGARALRRLDEAQASLGRLTASLGAAESSVREGLGGMERAVRAGDSLAPRLRRAGPQADSASARARALLNAYAQMKGPVGEALASLENITRLAARAPDSAVASSGKRDAASLDRLLNDDRDYNTLIASLEKLDSINRGLRKGGLGDGMKIKPRLKK